MTKGNSKYSRNKLSTKEFISKVEVIHKYTYDYSVSKYINARSNINIICNKHGLFSIKANGHMNGRGCQKCGKEAMSKTTEPFKKEAEKKHKGRYGYSKAVYTGAHNEITVTCKLHGDFNILAYTHTRGVGCTKCKYEARTKTLVQFIAEAREVHGDRYDYSESVYTTSNKHIKVICKIHGGFKVAASNHLRGKNCRLCGLLEQGFSRTDFTKNCLRNSSGVGVLYLIRCFNDEESFYKVGITSHSVDKRFPNKRSMPYDYEIIKELHLNPVVAYDAEKCILKDLVDHKHSPKITFGGETECFSELKPILKCLVKYLEDEGDSK